MRLNDGSRRSGAFELRVRHPPVIQDLGGNEAAMSSPLGSTRALEPDDTSGGRMYRHALE